ncbi:hypothetical protein PENTCL1PPCAC_20282, partial [Pristionchus entomophagus]
LLTGHSHPELDVKDLDEISMTCLKMKALTINARPKARKIPADILKIASHNLWIRLDLTLEGADALFSRTFGSDIHCQGPCQFCEYLREIRTNSHSTHTI